MPHTLQNAVLDLVSQVTGATIDKKATPTWLIRPGRMECGEQWPRVCAIYRELTGLDLCDTMPTKEWREVDGVLRCAGCEPRIIEVDESQHFNCYRDITLRHYPTELPVAFDCAVWIDHSQAEPRQKTGKWAAPKPPLFPGAGGRHRQRAFRDALTDILPLDNGFLPTLRIAYFEVKPWLGTDQAPQRMKELLDSKLSQ
jgi:hypothetical protein